MEKEEEAQLWFTGIVDPQSFLENFFLFFSWDTRTCVLVFNFIVSTPTTTTGTLQGVLLNFFLFVTRI